MRPLILAAAALVGCAARPTSVTPDGRAADTFAFRLTGIRGQPGVLTEQ